MHLHLSWSFLLKIRSYANPFEACMQQYPHTFLDVGMNVYRTLSPSRDLFTFSSIRSLCLPRHSSFIDSHTSIANLSYDAGHGSMMHLSSAWLTIWYSSIEWSFFSDVLIPSDPEQNRSTDPSIPLIASSYVLDTDALIWTSAASRLTWFSFSQYCFTLPVSILMLSIESISAYILSRPSAYVLNSSSPM